MSSEIRRTENEFILQNRNDSIADLVKYIAPGDTGKGVTLKFKCECSDLNCGREINLRIDEYQKVTNNIERFIVYPQHEQLDIETVVEHNPEYNVVEKRMDLVAKVA